MKRSILAIMIAAAMPLAATADTKSPTPDKPASTKLSAAEIQIVAHLHHVNVMEIDMGKAATTTATPVVKKYAQMLIDDHTSGDKDLVAFAKRRGIANIPVETATTDAEKADMKDMMDRVAKLKKLKGADFDREYLRMMIAGHDQELARTDIEIDASQDDELDKMLDARRATLTRHSDAAKELQKTNATAAK